MIETNERYIIGIYLRLSKDDELDDESLSIKNQRRILKDYINKNFDSDIEVYEYVDDGYSGMNNIRPNLTRLMEDIEKKKINCVIVKDCSRLARKNSLVSYYIEEFFYEENVRFISLLENFDNTKDLDTDKLLLPSIFNEYHVKNTSKKVRKTFENNARNGLFTGGFAPYGYIKDPKDKHKLLIDPYAADVVRYIFHEFISGNGLKSICHALDEKGIKIPSIYKGMNRGLKSSHFGLWTTKTISDMLHNPTYAGHLTQHKSKAKNISSKKKVKIKPENWIIKYNSCPAIIDDETFRIVQNIWEKNKRLKKNSYVHLLSGFLFCKECGHTLSIVKSTWKKKNGNIQEIFYCRCSYHKNYYKYNVCTNHHIRYDILEQTVINELKMMCKRYVKTENLVNILKNHDKILELKKEIEFSIKNKKNEIKKITNKSKNLYDDKLSGLVDKNMYLEFKEKYDKQIHILESELNELEKKLIQIKERSVSKESKYTGIINEFLKLDNINRDFILELIEKIEVDKDKNIYMYYKIKPLLDY